MFVIIIENFLLNNLYSIKISLLVKSKTDILKDPVCTRSDMQSNTHVSSG